MLLDGATVEFLGPGDSLVLDRRGWYDPVREAIGIAHWLLR
jgi:hypothetical protein